MNRRQSRNSQKANYRPGINTKGSSRRQSQVPRRRLSTRGSILPISEAGTAAYTDVTEASEAAPRAQYEPPPGYEVQSLHIILRYLERSRLEENFSKLLHMLLDRTNLPYNPYTGLSTRLRPYVEKFYMDMTPPERIEFILGTPLQETPVLNLYTPKDNPIVWGLSSVLRTVNPTALQKYKWLTENITPHPDDLYQSEEYSENAYKSPKEDVYSIDLKPLQSQVMVALVGPTIFHGTFYTESHLVQIRLEYLVAGPESTEGVSIFVNSVMLDIDAMYNNPYHILLGVNIPVQVDEDGSTWQPEFWDPDRIQDEKADFLQVMSDAVIGNKFIYVECVFKLEPNMSTYVRGQKQYGLNFIEVVDEIREEGLMCFSEFPMASLHEGVFLSQSHAEAYITIFSPQLDSVDAQNTKIESARPGSKVTRNTGQTVPHQETDRYSIHIHVHGRLEHFRPKKVRIDGFRLGEDPGFGPFAWQILTPFKAYLQKNIARCHTQGELFNVIFNVIILVLTERTDRMAYGENILSEIYRILHGTPGRLFMLMEHNKAVRALIRGFANSDDIHFVRQLLAEFKRDIEEMLSNSLQERTSDLTTAGQAMSGQVEELLSSDDFEFGSSAHLQQVVETFRNIDNYCITLMLQAVDDAVYWCPQLAALIDKMKTTFPEETKRPKTRIRERVVKKRTGLRPWEADEIFQHGREEEQILKHEQMVINVQMCIERDTAPKIMATESVLTKYVTDTHLDEFWQDFQVELFTGQYMPPNPYARLVTRCREGTMRMDLCYERTSTLLERLISGSAQPADEDNYVYQLPGCDGYGAQSSLTVLDVGAYVPVSQLVQQHFAPKNYIHRKGPFRIGVCMGIVGSALLYGKMQPYLNEIILEEHYYIQGPLGCERDALGLYAKMVYNHVAELIQLNTYPVIGVFMGEDNVRWTWEDILNKRQGFLTEFEMVCTRRETIYFKAYILLDEWRYVSVKKYFQLHWLTDDHLGKELYYPHNPGSFYHCLFLTKDRASFHYQNGGPRSGNPLSGPNIRLTFQWMDQQILKSRDKAEWIAVHRMLLLRSLMSQEDKHVVETWRMLHSIGAQAEYVCHLIESLQDLTIYAMEYEKWLNLDSPLNSGGKAVTGKTTGKTGKTAATVTDRKDPLDMKLLSKMTMAFNQKIRSVCDARPAMLPSSMLEYVEQKLKKILEEDKVTGELFPAIEDETVTCLEEVKQMMRAVQDTLAGDVHNISPHAQAAIAAIEADMEARPTSVASHRLDDPDQYKRRPRATKTIVEDDLLYKPK